MHVFEGCESEVNVDILLMTNWRIQTKTKKLGHNKLTLLNNDSISNVLVMLLSSLKNDAAAEMYYIIERETDVHRLSYLKDDRGALKMEIPVTIKTLIRPWLCVFQGIGTGIDSRDIHLNS